MLSTVIALAAAGVALLFLEMFLPGLVAGVIGGILLIAAIVTAYREIGIGAGNVTFVASAIVTVVLWWWWSAKFQHTRFGRRMTLAATGVGNTQAAGLALLVGQSGTAASALRPSGIILIAGNRVDAITGGEFLDPGTAVQVVRAEGSCVIVRRAD